MLNFNIERQHFLKPLRVVAGVVERHRAISLNPIAGQVLIRIENQNHLSLAAVDQEIQLIAGTRLAQPAANGQVLLPLRKLLDICSALPEEQILSFAQEKDTDRFVIRAGRSRFALSTIAAANFPVLATTPGALGFDISKATLRSLLIQTDYAMAEKDVRSYLNGLLWEIKGNKFYSVGADGHRLAFSLAEMEVSLEPLRIIVPRKAVVALQRILLARNEGHDADRIHITVGAQHIQLKTDEICLTAPLLDANFPDFWRIVNAMGDQVLTLGRESFKASLQRAAALLGDRSKGVSLSLSEGALKILASNAEQDEIEEDLVVDYQGPSFTIGFNIQYLLDFLSVLQAERLTMRIAGPNSSAHLVGVGGDTSGAYVIMPMSI